MQIILLTGEGKEIRYVPREGGLRQCDIIPCLRCGICCTRWQPEVDTEEANIIAQGLGISGKEFHRDYIEESPKKLGLCLLRRNEKGCIFLLYEGEKANCVIHSFRPAACRDWIPSMSRSECREGLKKRKSNDQLLLPNDIYSSEEEFTTFSHSLENANKIGVNKANEQG